MILELFRCFYSRKIKVLYFYNAKPPPLDYGSGVTLVSPYWLAQLAFDLNLNFLKYKLKKPLKIF